MQPAAVLLAAIYGAAVIALRANQIVAGTAINMLAMGTTPFLCKILYDVTGSTPAIPFSDQFRSAPLYLSWALVGLSFLGIKYTPAGLWLSFAGEHPEALDAAGMIQYKLEEELLTRDGVSESVKGGEVLASIILFGMIYAQAEDDFNRVETNYMTALGRTAEADGEKAIWADLRDEVLRAYASGTSGAAA